MTTAKQRAEAEVPQHFHDLPLPTKDWPMAGKAGTTIPVEQDTSTIQAFGISSNGRRIVGTHLNMVRNESHVITFSHIPGDNVLGGSGPAFWVADPIGQDPQASGRGINNGGDVVGFMLTAAKDPNQTVPYFRPGNVPILLDQGIVAAQPTLLLGAEIMLPDDRTASSMAFGINNHRIVAGYYIEPDGKSVGFSLDLRPVIHSTGLVNVGEQIPNATNSDKPDVHIWSINDRGDMLATSGALGNLVGLVDQNGQRKWFPVEVLDLAVLVGSGSRREVNLMGINNNRTIVGFVSPAPVNGFYCQVQPDGKTSPAVQISHPLGTGTQFHGISDDGVICGTYATDGSKNYNHPFIYQP